MVQVKREEKKREDVGKGAIDGETGTERERARERERGSAAAQST